MDKSGPVVKALLLFALLVLTGCQSWSPALHAPDVADAGRGCIDLARLFRDQVREARVSNAMAPALPTFPVLHVNRFLAALADYAVTADQQQQWVSRLAELGNEIRRTENAGLAQPWQTPVLDRLSRCANDYATQPRFVDARAELIAQVRQQPPVADAYIDAYQWLGLYPLFRPVYDWRIKLLHQEEKAQFGATNNVGEPRAYALQTDRPDLPPSFVARWLQDAMAGNALRLPAPTAAQLEQLFHLHAPRLVIDHADDNDAVAAPFWAGQRLAFAADRPTAYTLASFTRLGERNLLQLNYFFWFSGRKPTQAADLYAGDVDGLIWRVTLDEAGEVLLYDSIHSCGCYHKLFPVSDRLTARAEPLSEEPKNIFDVATLDSRRPVTLHLASNTHFIVGLDNSNDQDAEGYRLAPYPSLSMLTTSDGVRSLFDPFGIVPGSQRLERYTLWPTGIRDVGAMRQWGTHAIGFIDRQHFDDADLLDRYFLLKP